MKYKEPALLSEREVGAALASDEYSMAERNEILVSAIFNAESVEFAGDLLIDEFRHRDSEGKLGMFNLFGSFYGVRNEAYRFDDIATLLRELVADHPSKRANIEDEIEYLREYRDLFAHPDTK